MTAAPVNASYEAEYALLGGLVYDNRRVDAVADLLAPEDFADSFLGHVFGLIVSEHGQGRSANPITLRPLLAEHPGFETAGGNSFLARMAMAESLATPPLETAKLIVRQARRRRLSAGLGDSLALLKDPTASLEDVVDAADSAIVEAMHSAASATELTGAACMSNLLRTMDQPNRGVTCRIIEPIDKLVGQLRPTNLMILAARPGMGKTATGLSYSLGAAQAGHGVLFVSLEMSGTELAARMAADLSYDGRNGVPLDDILAPQPTRAAFAAVAQAEAMLGDMPLRVVDTGKLTIGRLAMIVRRHVRRMAAKGDKLELVVVDYLQLLSPDQPTRSPYEAVSQISMGLKQIAKDNGVAVMALAQLSREVERRADKRPQLSDLRDSGQIEQDADVVLFLVRDEYYLRQSEPEKNSPERYEWEQAMDVARGKLEFICAKHRHGTAGKTQGHFFTRFQAVRG